MTDSINQLGEIQIIGGVNQKIEGFYTTCKHKGLTGSQGLTTPCHNARNLKLKREVVEEVREGEFQVWSIQTLDKSLSLQADLDIGELQEDGTNSRGTFNSLVGVRLDKFGNLRRLTRRI